jgi:hypothetical protein
MFLINTFQWPWTYIAALITPRPLLFENSGHDTIFPMDGNERVRARLEKLYGFYTNRTDQLFDVGVTPGGHDDNPELRLMAYRWINWHLRGTNAPVTEPELLRFDGQQLRAFPEDLPADELNSKIDELFVPIATNALPKTVREYQSWREDRLAELRRLVFRSLPRKFDSMPGLDLGPQPQAGSMVTAPVITVYWKYFPASGDKSEKKRWFVVLGTNDSFDAKPDWLAKIAGDAAVLLVAPRGTGPTRWQDPPPYTIQRSLPLLGQTVDSGRLEDVLALVAHAISDKSDAKWTIAGKGQAGVIAAYAALLEPRLAEIVLVNPTPSHHEGPIFLNVLRVLDVPEALAMLAPRPLTIYAPQSADFTRTATIYGVAGGMLRTGQLSGN